MNTREQFGSYILLRKLAEDALGETFRAGRVGATGSIDQVVLLRVFNGQGLDGNSLWQQTSQRAEVQRQLSSPNLAQGLDYGEQQNVPYAAYDYISGKDLGALWEEANKQHNPIPTDQALLITERIALGLTSAYETRLRDQRVLHGFVNPHMVMVSNEGEIRLLGFEAAPGLRQLVTTNAAPRNYARYLSPEVLAGEAPEKSDDVYSLGAILYELLTGQALPARPAEGYDGLIDRARLAADEAPMPAELAGLLKRSLVERSERISDAMSWHKELNRLMIEGQYNPTTFNLAFFMHSLFRDDIERENREIQAEKSGEVSGEQQLAVVPEPTASDTVMMNTSDIVMPPPEAAPPAKRSILPMVAVAVLLLLGAAAAYYFLVLNKQAPAETETVAEESAEPAGPSDEEQRLAAELDALRAQMAEQMAQMAEMVDSQSSQSRENQRELQQQQESRLQELQQQLQDATAAREREAEQREEAEAAAQAAADQLAQKQEPSTRDTTTKNESPAETTTREQETSSGGSTSTPARTRLAQTTPPPPPPAATTTTTPPPRQQPQQTTTTTTTTRPSTPPPPAKQKVRRGELVTPGAGVVQPQILQKPDPRIPPVARRARRSGIVHLQILVDENGKVVDVKQEGKKVGLGLDEAAMKAARAIRARPATKDGVPVKMWIGVNYQFAL